MPKELTTVRDVIPVPVQFVERRIHSIRGNNAMLDRDLAELYGVPTFRLNEAVKRNIKRFPKDFMFQLTKAESEALTSQIAMSKSGRGGRRTTLYAFTEQGVAMIASILNNERAVLVNIAIVRAFVKLRQVMATHKELSDKIETLERKYSNRDEGYPTPASQTLTLEPGGTITFIGNYSTWGATGAINVTTNMASASFSLSGPANYTGSGLSFTQTGVPVGAYIITYGAIPFQATLLPRAKRGYCLRLARSTSRESTP
jgi:hypothetical protein